MEGGGLIIMEETGSLGSRDKAIKEEEKTNGEVEFRCGAAEMKDANEVEHTNDKNMMLMVTMIMTMMVVDDGC